MGDDIYKNSFENELPNLRTEEERKAVKAAVLRFINEFRTQIIEITSKNTAKIVTGETTVSTSPQVVLASNPDRKIAYIKNTGNIALKIYGVDEQTTGGFIVNSYEQVAVNGTNSVAVATLSGVSSVDFLDS